LLSPCSRRSGASPRARGEGPLCGPTTQFCLSGEGAGPRNEPALSKVYSGRLLSRRTGGLTLPFGHRFQFIGRLRNLAAVLVAVPLELVERYRDLVAADAEHAAGSDHQAVDGPVL